MLTLPRVIRLVFFGALFLLSFFGFWEPPKDWASAVVALNSIEGWWNAHAAHPSWAALLLGLLFGTVFLPAALSGFWSYQRPALDVEFDPENIQECRLDDGGPWTQFRMMVGNRRSNKTVHNCQGRVFSVESRSLARPYREKVPLTWAIRIDKDQIDLRHGDTLPLNVIEMRENETDLTAKFISPADANNSPHPFNALGEYQCVVAVTSDETRPKYISFTFDWTGDRTTAKIRNVRAHDKDPVRSKRSSLKG